jgi:fibrillarin-like pre-rRNA processing protein
MSIEVVDVRPHEHHYGVYIIKFEDGSERLATRNLTPGRRVYGERLVKWGGAEYREWNPYRSKLAAAIANGLKSQYRRARTYSTWARPRAQLPAT